MTIPLVSIITPSYNAEKYLSKTIDSVLQQTFQDWEMIIVDDQSPDNANRLIEQYCARDDRIKLIKLKKNSGAAVARNAAIEAAEGRYIAFLDSDDQWLPSKLRAQIHFMQEGSIALSYTAYEKLNEKGEIIGRVGVPEKVSYSDMLKTNYVGCLTAIYDTGQLGKVYMPLIRKRQDLGLWLKILKRTPYAYGLNEVLAQYQLRDDSVSANKKVAAQYTWRLYREVEQLSLVKTVYYFSHYAFNGILRSKFPKVAKEL